MPFKSVTEAGKDLLLFFSNMAGGEAAPQPPFKQ